MGRCEEFRHQLRALEARKEERKEASKWQKQVAEQQMLVEQGEMELERLRQEVQEAQLRQQKVQREQQRLERASRHLAARIFDGFSMDFHSFSYIFRSCPSGFSMISLWFGLGGKTNWRWRSSGRSCGA